MGNKNQEAPLQVTIELPDKVAALLREAWGNISRRLLEGAALEAYRSGELTKHQVRLMLGFETRTEVDAFLSKAGVQSGMTAEELEQDYEVSRRASAKRRSAAE